MRRTCNLPRRLGAAALGVLLFGCGTPQPPQLQTGDGPYENKVAGIRFQPPAGWRQTALIDPGALSGKITREVPLVKYKLLEGKRIGVLRLTAVDVPESRSLDEFLGERSPGLEDWQPQKPKSEPLEVNGRQGVRWSFTGRWEGQRATKEVVAVRTGERVYSFVGIFAENDLKARDTIRQAVNTVNWEFK